MGSFSRLLSGSGRSCDCCHVDLVFNQTGSGKRQSCKLDRCCKTSGVGHIMCGTYGFTRTFAQSVHEMSSGIITVKSEIIAEVDDPALRLDVMSVDELT